VRGAPAPTERPEPAVLVSALRGLVQEWKDRAASDVRYGVGQAFLSHREHFGPVNAGMAMWDCAVELAALCERAETQEPL
jgi:hypothetical protein